MSNVHVPGLLEHVSNLTVTVINSTTIFVSWVSPFTLEGVPILGYSVTIAKTRENVTISSTKLYVLEKQLYNNIIDDKNFPSLAITVVAINEGGAGQPITTFFLVSSVIKSERYHECPVIITLNCLQAANCHTIKYFCFVYTVSVILLVFNILIAICSFHCNKLC